MDQDELKRRIGETIKGLRKARGWSQERLARGAELSRETIRKIENGTTYPELETLGHIARALDSTVGDLLGIEVQAS